MEKKLKGHCWNHHVQLNAQLSAELAMENFLNLMQIRSIASRSNLIYRASGVHLPLMHLIDVTEDLSSESPAAKGDNDPRLQETLDRLDNLDDQVVQTLQAWKHQNGYISKTAENTEKRVAYLKEVHDASTKYWTIVSSAAFIIVAAKVIQGGATGIRKLKEVWKQNKSERGRRSHSREWNVDD